MEKNEKEEISNEAIYEKGEKLYPISDESKETDERCNKLYTIENWAELFYHLKEGKSKERFIELVKNSEYSTFFEGLNYEYGINNYPQDLKKAFQIYKEAANNTIDSLSMFRMYHIYKNDYKKFNIPKRIRIYEKFYIFKCFSFMRYPLIKRDQNLANRFDITYETIIHFEEEDKNFKIFNEFIEFLNTYYKLYDINPKDLIIIEAVVNHLLNDNINENEKKNSLQKLINISNEGNLEALYKLTCLTQDKNKEEIETEKMFKLLIDKGYNRSYIDYALYLNKKKRYKEALEVLKIARKNKVIPAGFMYYDILLEEIDFSLLMNEAINSSFSKECELYNLIEILIDDILTESVYSYFEFIFFRKIIIKHYNLEEQFNKHFSDYTKELAYFLIKITSETNLNKRKKIILKYFCRDEFFQELHLACGTLYFYGINNLIQKNMNKSLIDFIISYKSAESDSYKRFCYFYIYKIRKNIYEENKLKQINDNSNGFINENDLKDTEKKLFDKYYNSINEKIDLLSSSYFYYLSRLFHKKLGNNGDKLLEGICINKACEYRNDSPGNGSIISIYRKYKSKITKNKYEKEYKEEYRKNLLNDSEGYGDDGTICPICFEFKRNIIALPCKHLFCEFCINKLRKCPICRRNILMKYYLG